MPFDRLFTEHPRSRGETYVEHARAAAGFGGTMIVGGLACLVHAAVPALFGTAASSRVVRLHERLHSRKPRGAKPRPSDRWVLDYEI